MALRVLAYNLTRAMNIVGQTEPDCSHPRQLKAGKCVQKRHRASLKPPQPAIGRSDAKTSVACNDCRLRPLPSYPFPHNQDPKPTSNHMLPEAPFLFQSRPDTA